MSRNLREEMPWTAAILDDLRAAFGKEMIDGQIRRGLSGEPTFWARENSHRLGTRNTVHTSAIGWDAMGLAYSITPEWIKEARVFAASRGIEVRPADSSNPIDARREADELRKLIDAAKNKGKTQ